jgi:biotin carboxyl carrier protein
MPSTPTQSEHCTKLKEYDLWVNGKNHKILIKNQGAQCCVISTEGRDLLVSFDNAPSFGKTFAMMVESMKYEVSLSAPQFNEVDAIIAGQHFKTSFASESKTVPSTFIKEATEGREGTVVYAPMSGSIKSITVQVEQTVHAGQLMLILEAMKMENEITAPRDGMVKQIHVTRGSKISKNEALFTLA